MNSLLKIYSLGMLFSCTLMQASQIQPYKNKSVAAVYGVLKSDLNLKQLGKAFAQELLSEISDINMQDKEGNGLLILAADDHWGDVTVINFLLNNRPDLNVNLQNRIQETALETAIKTFVFYSPTAPENQVASRQIIAKLAAHGALFDITKLKDDRYFNLIKTMQQEVQEIYQAGRAIAEQREKEQAAYEMEVANKLQEHIPVKDLNNMIHEYTKMSLLEFIHVQKKQASTN